MRGRGPNVPGLFEVSMRTGSQLRHAAVFAALAATALTALFAFPAFAAVKSRVVDYSQNGTALQGYLAWDDAAKGKRPGVLVVHEWWGHNAHARRAADRLPPAGRPAGAGGTLCEGERAGAPAGGRGGRA